MVLLSLPQSLRGLIVKCSIIATDAYSFWGVDEMLLSSEWQLIWAWWMKEPAKSRQPKSGKDRLLLAARGFLGEVSVNVLCPIITPSVRLLCSWCSPRWYSSALAASANLSYSKVWRKIACFKAEHSERVRVRLDWSWSTLDLKTSRYDTMCRWSERGGTGILYDLTWLSVTAG